MTCELWRDWLDAYVDRSCTPEEDAGIEDHMRTCASCAAEALGLLQMKQATRAAAAARFTPSPELRLRIEKTILSKSMPLWKTPWLQGLAAASLAVVLLILSAILWTRHAQHEQAMTELLDLHVATTASTNPVDVISSDRHTVKPWFQGRLPFTFGLPELEGTPFKLLGGKLVYFKHTPGAQLLFELHKHQLSVFVFEESSALALHAAGKAIAREKGFSVESLSEAGLCYVIVSDTSPSDVHDLGELLRSAARQ